jgi:endonuclease YncB( thermonuclease family)
MASSSLMPASVKCSPTFAPPMTLPSLMVARAGDTFDTSSGNRVRLADVDTPENGEIGYSEAKDFLTSLVYQKTVYLDIDDVHRTDPYDRLVCVVYVDYNSTHLKNVNKALLVEGYAQIWEHDNEFNPSTWTLYVPKNPVPEFPTFIVLPLLVIVTVIGVLVFRRLITKRTSTS